jgi:hypothetical protein
MQIYGEAVVFVRAQLEDQSIQLVVYQPLTEVSRKLCTLRGKWDTQGQLHIAPVELIVDIVGIWESEVWVYILRKHAGLELLSMEEKGQQETGENEQVNTK